MACPKSFSTINKKERFTKLLKERAEKKQEQIIIPEPSLMSQMCLEIHLIPTRSLFMDATCSQATFFLACSIMHYIH